MIYICKYIYMYIYIYMLDICIYDLIQTKRGECTFVECIWMLACLCSYFPGYNDMFIIIAHIIKKTYKLILKKISLNFTVEG